MEPSTLPGLIRTVLGSPHSEQVIKTQIIQLAAKNLHQPGVTTALLEVLPLTKDKETRDQLVHFLSGLNTSRFSEPAALFDALLNVFRMEKDRDTRTTLLFRLQTSIHQDPRLAGFFIELSAEPSLSEQERSAVQQALATLPVLSEEQAIAALEKNRNAPTVLQLQALDLAEKCPAWTDKMISALRPYLDPKNDRTIRFRILDKLAEAHQLHPAYTAVTLSILRTDNDTSARLQALKVLSRIHPWDGDAALQLMWSATNDTDEEVRRQALRLQNQQPELTNEQLISLAGLLAIDHSAGVRLTILSQLKPVMRIHEIRTAIAASFSGNPGIFANDEFNALIDMLAPYAGRDPVISEKLMSSVRHIPNTTQRKKVLHLLLPTVRTEIILLPLLDHFAHERDESLRATLFQQLKGLSVTRHPELVDVFCQELTEPGSPFRITCAGILANAAETYPAIVAALEDVLLHDTDRQLVSLCLDGYLRPGLEKRFAPLSSVVGNELLDTLTRQKALDALLKLSLSEPEQERLTAILSGLKPGTLKSA